MEFTALKYCDIFFGGFIIDSHSRKLVSNQPLCDSQSDHRELLRFSATELLGEFICNPQKRGWHGSTLPKPCLPMPAHLPILWHICTIKFCQFAIVLSKSTVIRLTHCIYQWLNNHCFGRVEQRQPQSHAYKCLHICLSCGIFVQENSANLPLCHQTPQSLG